MSDRHAHEAPPAGAPIDQEIDSRHILEVGVWLAGITIGAFLVGYFLYRGIAGSEHRAEPAPSPIPAATAPQVEPEPHLQSDAVLELREMRSAEDARLESYGWVDQSQGIAHIPIDRALAIVAAQEAAKSAAPAPPAATAAKSEPGGKTP